MKTILIPTDFSENAGHALKLGTQIARRSGAKILVLHIVEGMRHFSFNTMGELDGAQGEEVFIFKKLIEEAQKRLNNLVADEQYEGLSIEAKVEIGSAYSGIAKTIADHETDLVIMGSKGSSGLDEVFIGSNTEKVVRYAHCPVITVKDEVDLSTIERITFATDLLDDQSLLIEKLKEIQALTGASLDLVKVNTPNKFQTQRKMEQDFDEFILKNDIKNASKAIYNDTTEEEGVLAYAADSGASMIAMGTHGRRGLLHLLSGSIAEDLVNHAALPVWTFSMR